MQPLPTRDVDSADAGADGCAKCEFDCDADRLPDGGLPVPPADALVLAARELFAGRRELWIDHDGVRYRLRITRRNKLILQK